jgi:hypothetical protein
MSAGQVMTGGVVSTTSTVCVAVFSLPLASRPVHVTVVTPSGKLSGASCFSMGDGSQTSLAVPLPNAGDAPCGDVHSTRARLGGAATVGFVLSPTVA